MPLEFILSQPQGINGYEWPVECLSSNKNLTLETIEQNPTGSLGKSWEMSYLSLLICLTSDFVKKYPNGINDKRWDNDSLVANRNLPWDFFVSHPKGLNGIAWNIKGLSKRVPLEFIENNPSGFFGQTWEIFSLAKNPNLPFSFFEEFYGSFQFTLSMREDLPWHLVRTNNCPFELSVGGLMFNPSLPLDFLESHLEGVEGQRWNLKPLSSNKGLRWNLPVVTKLLNLIQMDFVDNLGSWIDYVNKSGKKILMKFDLRKLKSLKYKKIIKLNFGEEI